MRASKKRPRPSLFQTTQKEELYLKGVQVVVCWDVAVFPVGRGLGCCCCRGLGRWLPESARRCRGSRSFVVRHQEFARAVFVLHFVERFQDLVPIAVFSSVVVLSRRTQGIAAARQDQPLLLYHDASASAIAARWHAQNFTRPKCQLISTAPSAPLLPAAPSPRCFHADTRARRQCAQKRGIRKAPFTGVPMRTL